MNIKDRIAAWLRSAGVWVNAGLLAAFPFTDQIVYFVGEYLPSFAPYLPPNIYKAMGFAVVAFNMARSIQRLRRARAARSSNG